MLKGEGAEKLRVNPRKAWYSNLERITTNGDYEATFHLKRPQPAFLALLASGMSPVYPCHVAPKDMRQHPIGTGPFKFVEFKPNEYIKLAKNPDYWKKGLPYLDGIEWTIIPNRSTQTLAFIAGKFDMTFPYEATVQSMRDIEAQAPDAICELTPTIVAINLLLNRDSPPFDDPDIRLKPQMNANVEFITAKHENVLTVPNEAIKEQDGRSNVGRQGMSSGETAASSGTRIRPQKRLRSSGFCWRPAQASQRPPTRASIAIVP